jgi:hypothetical protein
VLDIPIVTITETKVLVGESYPRLDDSDSLDRFQRERSDESGAWRCGGGAGASK